MVITEKFGVLGLKVVEQSRRICTTTSILMPKEMPSIEGGTFDVAGALYRPLALIEDMKANLAIYLKGCKAKSKKRELKVPITDSTPKTNRRCKVLLSFACGYSFDGWIQCGLREVFFRGFGSSFLSIIKPIIPMIAIIKSVANDFLRFLYIDATSYLC